MKTNQLIARIPYQNGQGWMSKNTIITLIMFNVQVILYKSFFRN